MRRRTERSDRKRGRCENNITIKCSVLIFSSWHDWQLAVLVSQPTHLHWHIPWLNTASCLSRSPQITSLMGIERDNDKSKHIRDYSHQSWLRCIHTISMKSFTLTLSVNACVYRSSIDFCRDDVFCRTKPKNKLAF